MASYMPIASATLNAPKALSSGDGAYIPSGVTIAYEVLANTLILGGGNTVQIDGMLNAVMGVGFGGDHDTLYVGKTGQIWAVYQAVDVTASGTDFNIVNAGTIFAAYEAIAITATVSTVHIINAGTIHSGYGSSGAPAAIITSGDTGSHLLVINTGTIQADGNGGQTAFIDSGNSTDEITNTGYMIGVIGLGAGADKYTGSSGHHTGGSIYGGAGADTIATGADNDVINGGGDADRLTGGKGNDRFEFTWSLGGGNIDTITDFTHAADKFVLDHLVFTALSAGKLASGAFYAAAGASKAHDADDRIVYNKSNGALYYDDDGKGGHAAVEFAILSNHPATISAADFLIT